MSGSRSREASDPAGGRASPWPEWRGPLLTAAVAAAFAIGAYVFAAYSRPGWFNEHAGSFAVAVLFALGLVGLLARRSGRRRFDAIVREMDARSAALRASEAMQRARAEELRSILEVAPAAIWIARDTDCTSVTGSRFAHDVLRQPRGANLSKTAPAGERPTNFRILDVDGVEIASEDLPLQVAARTGRPVGGFREYVEFEDGTRRVLFGSAIPTRDGDGRVTGAVAAFVDISALDAAEAALRQTAAERERALVTIEQQRSELQTILDVMPVGVAIAHDAHVHRVTVSPYFADLIGLPRSVDASPGAPPRERLPYRFVRRGVELSRGDLPLEIATRTAAPVRELELDALLVDGRTIHLLCNAAPLFDEKGSVRGAVMAAVDVTALKLVQRELEAADRQKNEFLATLAHELRNPMAPIRYATALLRDGTPPATLEQARRLIDRQSTQMARLLDDLLDMSRITRNAIELKRARTDLRAILTDAIDAAQPAASAQRHRIDVSLPDAPVWIDGDSARLLQIAGNLIHNAVKYTPPEGRIAIALERDGDVARLSVRDTGIGLAEEMIPRVFDLFSQVHKGYAGSHGGLGIGLAVVKRLVELHGGTIGVRSAGLGRGAEFTVALPITVGGADAPAGAAGVTALYRSQPRVLVVDDNFDAADGLAMLLRSHGIAVFVAHGGAEALSLADAVRPDVVVLDLGMPRLSGEDVARQLRLRDWGAALRIVAVTGWGQEIDRERTRAAGFDLHLVKPVDPDVLLAALLPAAAPSNVAATHPR